tara:strand:+ start:176 stop:415 length:240 start_codon:yes stop_codon:yes gene_type:complete
MKKPKVSEKIRTSLFGRGTKKFKKFRKFRNPALLGLGLGVASYGIFKKQKEIKPKLVESFGKLPKSDPRYKALKKAGYV